MRKTLLSLAVLLLAGTLAFAAGEGERAAPGEMVTLTMFGGLNPRIVTPDSPENEYTAWMEEKFGVEIEWVAVPNQDSCQSTLFGTLHAAPFVTVKQEVGARRGGRRINQTHISRRIKWTC